MAGSALGQREDSYVVQQEKEAKLKSDKIHGWIGEKVILLPQITDRPLWCHSGYGDEDLYFQIRFHGGEKDTGTLHEDKYAGKTGKIINNYLDDFNDGYVVVLLDSSNEKISGPVRRFGFFKEFEFTASLVGKPLGIKVGIDLGIANEYCKHPKSYIHPRKRVRTDEKFTVTRVEWGTDLQHIHLFGKTNSEDELVFDGFDGYNYFVGKYNIIEDCYKGDFSLVFSVDIPSSTVDFNRATVKTLFGPFQITNIQESNRFPPDCDSTSIDCEKVEPGYKALVIWLKSNSPDSSSIDFSNLSASNGVYIIDGDGTRTNCFSGGKINGKHLIAFTPPVKSNNFILYWPGNSPIPLDNKTIFKPPIRTK
jgi:hypothetical protein